MQSKGKDNKESSSSASFLLEWNYDDILSSYIHMFLLLLFNFYWDTSEV